MQWNRPTATGSKAFAGRGMRNARIICADPSLATWIPHSAFQNRSIHRQQLHFLFYTSLLSSFIIILSEYYWNLSFFIRKLLKFIIFIRKSLKLIIVYQNIIEIYHFLSKKWLKFIIFIRKSLKFIIFVRNDWDLSFLSENDWN